MKGLTPVRAALLAAVAALVSACSSSSTSPAAQPGATVSPGPTGSPPGSAPPAATATPASPAPAVPTASALPARATLAGCPAARPFSALPVFATLGTETDDLIVTADGHVWATLNVAGQIVELASDGTAVARVADQNGPEGLVQLPDGSILVAEQNANRIRRLDPATHALSAFLQLTNRTANAGLDGIGYDPVGNRVLVPDSPNGTLLAVPPGGGTPATLAVGLGRPVAAYPDVDGSIVVALENAPGIVRVARTSATTAVGHLTDLDEAVPVGSLLYATDLAGHALHAVDPATGRDVVIVSGSPEPQGLAARADGTLLLADAQRGAIVVVDPCR